MQMFARLTLALSIIAAAASPAFAQTAMPSVENGGLIPAGLIVWLLPVAAALSAALLVLVDRKLRSGKTAV